MSERNQSSASYKAVSVGVSPRSDLATGRSLELLPSLLPLPAWLRLLFEPAGLCFFACFGRSLTSKFIGNPCCYVIDVQVRAGVLQKLAGKKVGVDGNEGDASVNIPF